MSFERLVNHSVRESVVIDNYFKQDELKGSICSDFKVREMAHSCEVMPDGRVLVSSRYARNDIPDVIRIYNPLIDSVVIERKILKTEEDTVGISGLVPLPNGFILCNYNFATWLLDPNTLQSIRKITGMCLYGISSVFGNYFIHPNQHDDRLTFCDLVTYETKDIKIPAAKKGWIYSVVPLSENRLAISTNNKIIIFHYNHAKSELVLVSELIAAESSLGHGLHLIALPDERLISIKAKEKGEIKLWNTRTLQCTGTAHAARNVYSWTKSPLLLPDGKTLVCRGIRANEICILNVESLRSTLFSFPNMAIIDFTILSNGKIVLAAENTLLIVDLDHIRNLRVSKSKKEIESSLALFSDAHGIVSDYVGDDVHFTVREKLGQNPSGFFWEKGSSPCVGPLPLLAINSKPPSNRVEIKR